MVVEVLKPMGGGEDGGIGMEMLCDVRHGGCSEAGFGGWWWCE